jgi:hypothetical protein
MSLEENPIAKRIFKTNCPFVAFWFPWYWRRTETAQLRKLAGQWIWLKAHGIRAKIVIMLKTILWPLIALSGIALLLISKSKNTKKGSGRPVFNQLLDLLYFTYWRGFSPLEYYRMRFYKLKLSTVIDDFISSKEVSILNMVITDGRDPELVNDKLRFDEQCSKFGLTVVPILEVYRNGIREIKGTYVSVPRTSLYFKPVKGLQGRGIERWNYDEKSETWRSENDLLNEKALIAHFQETSKNDTYILQKQVTNHQSLAAFSQGAVITFRIMTVIGADKKLKTIAAYASIPYGTPVVNHGIYGGIVVRIDHNTGVFDAAYSIVPPADNITHHAKTGAKIEGYQLNEWPELEALAKTGHSYFPESYTIGWDLVLTADGPQILEGNTQWGVRPGLFVGKTSFVTQYMNFLSNETANALNISKRKNP